MSGDTASPSAVRDSFRARLYDLAAVLPLIIWLVLGAAGLAKQIGLDVAHNPASPRLVLQIASEATIIAFLALQIALFLVRRLPVAKGSGIVPRAVAAAASNAGLLFLAVPRVPLHTLAIAIASYLLVTAGMILSVVVLIWLGRSFSIFPQARKLVSTGPYTLVRHPLYLSEFLSSLGGMLQFAQPWSALIALGILAAQIPRMHFEEDILRRTFPQYADYAIRTRWRLIPFIY